MHGPTSSRPLRLPALTVLLVTLIVSFFTGCGSGIANTAPAALTASATPTPALTPVNVSIAPQAGEDLAAPCEFDLLLTTQSTTQKGVLLIYERGDSALLFEDSSLRDAANTLGFAMLWAHQCNAASYADFQPNAARGPARMLTSALAALATQTTHPELATVPVVPYGFSAAGVLSLTLAEQLPTRVLAAVSYAAGAALLDLDSVTVSYLPRPRSPR